jgi:hypothetical protein
MELVAKLQEAIDVVNQFYVTDKYCLAPEIDEEYGELVELSIGVDETGNGYELSKLESDTDILLWEIRINFECLELQLSTLMSR